MSQSADNTAFLSVGPVWRFQPEGRPYYVDLGISPTVLSESTFSGRELGGHLHFSSSITLGTRFGAEDEFGIALRLQHTSNGGLDSTNPGLDAIAVNFSAQTWSF